MRLKDEVEDDLEDFIEMEDGKKIRWLTSLKDNEFSNLILRPSSTSSTPSLHLIPPPNPPPPGDKSSDKTAKIW